MCALCPGVIALFTATSFAATSHRPVLLSYPGIFVLPLCTVNAKPSVMLMHVFSESAQMYVDGKGASIYFRIKEIGVGVNSENHSNGQVWQLTIHQEFAQSFLTVPCNLIYKLWGCSLFQMKI